jgi:hypothetical protein
MRRNQPEEMHRKERREGEEFSQKCFFLPMLFSAKLCDLGGEFFLATHIAKPI